MKTILSLISFALLTFTATAQSGPVKRVLLEEFSTAPCGFCPDGGLVAQDIISKEPKAINFTHHAGFGTDSMTISESVTIANAFTTFAPACAIDRGDYKIPVYTYPDYIGVSRQKWDSITQSLLKNSPVADLDIKNKFDSATGLLNCTIDTKFYETPAAGDLRLNILVVEDSVKGVGHGYDQKNYFNYDKSKPTLYQKGDTIKGYMHRHVLRSMPLGTWGKKNLFTSTPEVSKLYTYTAKDIKIDKKWKNRNIDIIAFVSYYNSDFAKMPVLNSNHKDIMDTSNIYLGIKENTENSIASAAVYPNPSNGNGSIFLNCLKDEKIHVSITDIQGRTVSDLGTSNFNTGIHTIPFSITNAKGMYIVKLVSSAGSTYSKILIAE